MSRLFALLALLNALGGLASAADIGRDIYLSDGPQRRACVHCHLRDGSGSGEGSTPAPPISWSILSRERGYASLDDLARTLRTGIGPDGRKIAMPQVAISDAEAAALLRYLNRLTELDRRGVRGGDLVIGVGQTGPDDPFPLLLAKAMVERNLDRPVFGLRAVLRPIPVAEVRLLDSAAEIVAVVGLPEPWPAEGTRTLVGAGIPNVMPRGYLAGSEPPYDAVGLLPTLAQLVNRVENLELCAGTELALRTNGAADGALLATRLRLPVADDSASGCHIALDPRDGATGVPSIQVTIAQANGETRTLVFDPMVGLEGREGGPLMAFARLLAAQIESTLMALRGNPGRVRFLRAFRQADSQPTNAAASLDWRFPRLGAMTRIELTRLDAGRSAPSAR